MSMQLVLRLFTAAERLDVQAIATCLHERCVFHNQPLPKWTAARGLPAVRRQLRSLLWLVREYQVLDIRQAAFVGDALVVERFERLRVFGRNIELEVMAVFRFRDERIVLWQDSFSLRALLRQLFWPRRVSSN
ncbi:nuclear transport factor 2 family protein [Pseudomonas sp. J452]|uniref:nuclear transport factor 2 family protein n=1 Tax=Pseudomonas sp. J452 TaxID=2898441 RepID=UPI0021AE21F3|nr:nuclear transport factor 2 family protein [Pseudomonas sp. J452]UUY10210.1 nuclear transport factor 2 family protein [Pseudomonas sp. J452]